MAAELNGAYLAWLGGPGLGLVPVCVGGDKMWQALGLLTVVGSERARVGRALAPRPVPHRGF